MSVIERSGACQEIEIGIALCVVQPAALGALENHGERAGIGANFGFNVVKNVCHYDSPGLRSERRGPIRSLYSVSCKLRKWMRLSNITDSSMSVSWRRASEANIAREAALSLVTVVSTK